MREIKFRAWHTVNKVMYDHKSIPVLLKNIGDDNVWKFMQFTGFYDRNDKQIFEGDITFYVAETYDDGPQPFTDVVEFQDGSYCIKSNELYWAVKEIQVIGNIYENPDLINPT